MYRWGTGTALAGVLLFGWAAVAQDSTELRARAEKEIRQTGQVQSRSTDAQVSESMLHLQDPLPEAAKRRWDYFLSLSLQSFTPSGTGGNDLVDSRFEMKEAGSTIMPSLAAGFRARALTREAWTLSWGLGAHVGYSSEKNRARFTTGYTVGDATLNSTLLSADPMLSLVLTRWPKLAFNAGGQFGTVNYTQSSSNKLAAFSERADFYGRSLGLEYALLAHWSVLTNYVHRELAAVSKIGLQPDNYELGTRVTW